MRPNSIILLGVFLASLIAACSPERGAAHWGDGSGPGFCDAIWNLDDPVVVHLAREPGQSGLAVFNDDLGNLPIEQPVPDARLEVNGKEVRAPARSIESNGRQGLLFPFNPRPLMRRNPDGFSISVLRGGKPVFRADLPGARETFRKTLRCDVKALFGEEAQG